MFSQEQLKKILTKGKVLSEKEFKDLVTAALDNNKSLETWILEQKIVTQEGLYQEAAKYFKLPFIDFKNQKIDKMTLLKIPEAIAISHNLIAFSETPAELKIAMLDPEDLEILEFIKKKTGQELSLHLTTPANIKFGLRKYRENIKSEIKHISEGTTGVILGADGKNLKKLAEGLTIVKIFNDLIEYAIFQEASDIHIEAEEKEVVVRYRIDGILRQVMVLDKNMHAGIVARVKILSNLKVDEHRLPQDGRFKMSDERFQLSFRVSIIPTFDGEKIVIRLLNEKSQVLNLDQLGLEASALEAVKKNIKKPHGMILVTGPTGSGKSTTLYTILGILNTPKINISTIEDPIEYRMPHVNQSQVSPKIGYTFASGLRAFLRQDPDVIMVGEIRDQETAEIAIHAAMTGHLLLSTLHTNDAVTTLPRLSQMGIPSFLIASTTNLIISQRLVRKVCQNCKKEYQLDRKMIDEMKKKIDIEEIFKKLIKNKRIEEKSLEATSFFRGQGCKKCSETGYKGRLGIYEVLSMSPEMSEVVLNNAGAAEIQALAEKQGMLTLIEDGVIKALQGITSLEEIMRVTKD